MRLRYLRNRLARAAQHENTRREAGVFMLRDQDVSRVLWGAALPRPGDHLSGTPLARRLERRSLVRHGDDAGTALHRGKDLAVSVSRLPSKLIRFPEEVDGSFLSVGTVSVRTSRLAADGNYPLPGSKRPCERLAMPGLSS